MNTHRFSTRLLLSLAFSIPLGACEDTEPLGPEVDANLTVAEASHGHRQEVRGLPFHGNTTGMLIGQTFPAPEGRCPAERPILAEYVGKGKATHLGRITVVGGECMYFDPTDPGALSSGDGRFRITAANGDWLDVAYDLTTLQFEAPPSPWVVWSAPVRIVEGGGRFEGAEFLGVIWAGGYNALTHETYSKLDGRIQYDASARKRGRDWDGS